MEKKINFDVKEVSKEEIIITDTELQYGISFKKLKKFIKLYVHDREKTRVIKLSYDDIESKVLFKEKVCEVLNDFEELSVICDDVGEQLFDLVSRWEDYEVQHKLRKVLEEKRKPKLVIKDKDSIIEVYESDGLRIPITGGLISFGHEVKAVIETTYVFGKVVRDVLEESEATFPVMAISVYVKELEKEKLRYRWVLKERKVEFPIRSKYVEIYGKPVLIEARSVGKDALETLMGVEALKEFKEGAVGKSFSEVGKELKNLIKKYISFYWDERLYDVFISHIVGTYFFDFFPAYPILYFVGPYGSGKTRAGYVWAYTSHRGLVIIEPSEASIFRSIEAYKPSIYIDEKAFGRESLRTLLSAGYKEGVKVPRIEKTSKEKFILSLFNIYSPKAFGYVDEPPELLAQRCVKVSMERAEGGVEWRDPTPKDFEGVRNDLYLIRLTRAGEVFEAMDFISSELSKLNVVGREWELWYPLLVMAYLLGKDVYENVKSYMMDDIRRRREELYSEEKLVLEAIEEIFLNQKQYEISFQVIDLQEKIKEILINEGSYIESTFKKQWEARKLGKLLTNRLKVRRSKVGKGSSARYVRFINIDEFLNKCKKFNYTPSEDLLKLAEQTKSVMSVKSVISGEKKQEKISNQKHISGSAETEPTKESGSAGTEPTKEESVIRSVISERKLPVSLPTTATTVNKQNQQDRTTNNKTNGKPVPASSPEKLPTLPTLPTSAEPTKEKQTSGLGNQTSTERLGVVEAIEEILGSGAKSDIEIYRELVGYQREGKLREGIIIDFNKVLSALKVLEENGVITKVYDEREGTEKYVLSG